MKKKRLVTGIIVLMAVSLIIIIVLQCIHIINSYNESKNYIKNSIDKAVEITIHTLRKRDAYMYAYNKMGLEYNENSEINNIPVDPLLLELGIIPFVQNDNFSRQNTYIQDNINPLPDNASQVEEYVKKIIRSEPQMKVEQLVMQIESEFLNNKVPIENRFETNTISNILLQSLSSSGLNLEFEFAITDHHSNIRLQSENFDLSKIKVTDVYKYNITPQNILQAQNYIVIYFPTLDKHTIDSVFTQLATSLSLTLLFIITFSISLFALLRQKKISEVKNDFINNMTHEFKTPIATIKLATASLKNAKTKDNQDITTNMLDIITQETSRMNHHIEQVLQMALLDKKNLEITKHKEDINEIIHDVVINSELVVSEKGGNINLITIDENVFLNVDRELMSNVFSNLIDNAIKYSKGAPEIKVTTFIEGKKFHIAFKDNGIGMSKEYQEKIFDKFFRAPTGNIHNTKGFGIGLNYAKEVVFAHKGDITVRSSPGKGSTFTVILPMK